MKRGPKKGFTRKNPVPLKVAVSLIGPDELWQRGGGYGSERSKKWRKDQLVPADVVSPDFVKWWESQHELVETAKEQGRQEVRAQLKGIALPP